MMGIRQNRTAAVYRAVWRIKRCATDERGMWRNGWLMVHDRGEKSGMRLQESSEPADLAGRLRSSDLDSPPPAVRVAQWSACLDSPGLALGPSCAPGSRASIRDGLWRRTNMPGVRNLKPEIPDQKPCGIDDDEIEDSCSESLPPPVQSRRHSDDRRRPRSRADSSESPPPPIQTWPTFVPAPKPAKKKPRRP